MTKLKKKKIWRVKIAIKKSLGLFKGRARYRRSLQLSKKNIQRFKKLNLLTFLIFVRHFCPPGSGSNPNPKPDPQHCCYLYVCSDQIKSIQYNWKHEPPTVQQMSNVFLVTWKLRQKHNVPIKNSWQDGKKTSNVTELKTRRNQQVFSNKTKTFLDFFVQYLEVRCVHKIGGKGTLFVCPLLRTLPPAARRSNFNQISTVNEG